MNRYTLYFNRLTAHQVYQFLSSTDGILFNVVWHLPASFANEMSQNVYCELTGDLANARTALAAIAKNFGVAPDAWKLLPDQL